VIFLVVKFRHSVKKKKLESETYSPKFSIFWKKIARKKKNSWGWAQNLPQLPITWKVPNNLLFSYFEHYQIWLSILTYDYYMKLHYKIMKNTHTHTKTHELSLYNYLKTLCHTQNIRLQACSMQIKRHVRKIILKNESHSMRRHVKNETNQKTF